MELPFKYHLPRTGLLVAALLLAGCCPPAQNSCKPTPNSGSATFALSNYPKSGVPRSMFREAHSALLTQPLIGVGDRIGFPLDGGVKLTHVDALEHGVPLNSVAVWITKDVQPDWVPAEALERAAADGVTPVFLMYYFAAENSSEDAQEHRYDWYQYLAEFAAHVSGETPVVILLEPEINDMGAEANGKEPLMYWPGLQEMLMDGLYIVRTIAPNAVVGICFGDFGPEELEPWFGEAVAYSDVVAFQEMRASTRNADLDPTGKDLAQQVLETTKRLHRSFDKPVLLAYLAMSSYQEDGGPEWTQIQALAIQEILGNFKALHAEGLWGMLYFQLRDDPNHVGFFKEAEVDFGLLDELGNPKPAMDAFRQGAEAILYQTPVSEWGNTCNPPAPKPEPEPQPEPTPEPDVIDN